MRSSQFLNRSACAGSVLTFAETFAPVSLGQVLRSWCALVPLPLSLSSQDEASDARPPLPLLAHQRAHWKQHKLICRAPIDL